MKTKITLVALGLLLLALAAVVLPPLGGTQGPKSLPATVVPEADAEEAPVAPTSRGLLIARWTDEYGFEDGWYSWRAPHESWRVWLARCRVEVDDRAFDPHSSGPQPLPELESSDPVVSLAWSTPAGVRLEVRSWKAPRQTDEAWALELLNVRQSIEACFAVALLDPGELGGRR